MCNLYSLTKGQAAIRDWFRARQDRTGNLPLFPGIFPDQMAPVVRAGMDGDRELVIARWGMPGPPRYGGAARQTETFPFSGRAEMFPLTVPLGRLSQLRLGPLR
jgi:putative SOS response-associated peptidase YedK